MHSIEILRTGKIESLSIFNKGLNISDYFLLDMEYITNTFRYVLGFSNKKDITGYVVSENKMTNQTLLMVQKGEKCWEANWYPHEEYNIHPIPYSMNSIFKNN